MHVQRPSSVTCSGSPASHASLAPAAAYKHPCLAVSSGRVLSPNHPHQSLYCSIRPASANHVPPPLHRLLVSCTPPALRLRISSTISTLLSSTSPYVHRPHSHARLTIFHHSSHPAPLPAGPFLPSAQTLLHCSRRASPILAWPPRIACAPTAGHRTRGRGRDTVLRRSLLPVPLVFLRGQRRNACHPFPHHLFCP